MRVTLDPVFDLATIVGKVYSDADGDGWQDLNDVGIAGAMVVLGDGTCALTDQHGPLPLPGHASAAAAGQDQPRGVAGAGRGDDAPGVGRDADAWPARRSSSRCASISMCRTGHWRALVDGQPVSTEPDAHFSHRLQLQPGVSPIVVEAIDEVGNIAFSSVLVRTLTTWQCSRA